MNNKKAFSQRWIAILTATPILVASLVFMRSAWSQTASSGLPANGGEAEKRPPLLGSPQATGQADLTIPPMPLGTPGAVMDIGTPPKPAIPLMATPEERAKFAPPGVNRPDAFTFPLPVS